MTQTVVHFTDTTAFGGTEQMLLRTLAGMDRRRWRPLLFHHPAPAISSLLEAAHRLGVETRAVPRLRGLRRGVGLSRFVRELRAEGPAVFHAHLPWPLRCTYGLVGAKLAGVPAIIATQQLYGPVRSRGAALKHRLVARGVDRYIAVSRGIARELGSLVPARKIRVIPNSIQVFAGERPRAADLRRQLSGSSGRAIVLTLARLNWQKGLEHLLAAAALVPDAQFVVAGDGEERERLETMSRRLALTDRVLFLGHRSDVADLLAACDVFVLPSLLEGLPVSVLEAMAAGRPVVATAVPGSDEAVVDGATGLLVPPADPAALAAAIGTLLRDHELRQRLGRAGRARVHEEFAETVMIERITAVYEEVLGGGE